jgi:hypothetical protein
LSYDHPDLSSYLGRAKRPLNVEDRTAQRLFLCRSLWMRAVLKKLLADRLQTDHSATVLVVDVLAHLVRLDLDEPPRADELGAQLA